MERLFFILAILSINACSSYTINCKYGYTSYGDFHDDLRAIILNSVYVCFGDFLNDCDNSLTLVTAVSVNHIDGNTFKDVKVFSIENETGNLKTPKIPSGISKFFKDIEGFYYSDMQLEEIEVSNLPYKKLKFLTLRGNKLTHLPGDLFAYTKKLQNIWLTDNPIVSIDPNIFDKVPALFILDVVGTTCIGDYNDPHVNEMLHGNSVAHLKSVLRKKCKPTGRRTHEEHSRVPKFAPRRRAYPEWCDDKYTQNPNEENFVRGGDP